MVAPAAPLWECSGYERRGPLCAQNYRMRSWEKSSRLRPKAKDIEALYQKATGLVLDRGAFSSDSIFVQCLSFEREPVKHTVAGFSNMRG